MNIKKSIFKPLFLLPTILVIHVILLSNLQFTAWPEMFSFPYMIDSGFVIYKDFHHVYQPLLTFILLGVFKVFGFNLTTLKVFTFVLIMLIDLMIFANLKQITKNNTLSLLGLVIFVLLQPLFDGNMLWFDLAVVLPILISIYFVTSNLFWSGFYIAISFLIKQQAALLVLLIFVYLLVSKKNKKDILKFIYGAGIPILVLLLFLFKLGIISDYFFWTFEFPLIHLPKIPGYSITPNTRDIKIMAVLFVTLLVGAIFNYKKIKKSPRKTKFYLYLSILFLLILSAFPRYSLFHLQPALAVYVLMIGYLLKFRKRYFVILLLIPVYILGKNALITKNFEDRFYGTYEKQLSQEIKTRSQDEKVYLLGPSSVNYVLSETISPKPWIENYVWHFEIPGLQEKVIDGWEIDPPIYIYWTKPKPGNWYDLATYQPDKIVKYINSNYEKIDQVENVEIWKFIKR